MTDLTRRKKELLKSYNNLCSCYGDIISEQTKTINRLKELMEIAIKAIKLARDTAYSSTQDCPKCSFIDEKLSEAIAKIKEIK